MTFVLALVQCVWTSCAFAQSNYKIAGVVVHAFTGAAVAGAEVSIAPNSARQVAQTVLTEDDGRFVFENLSAGKYVLAANRRGFGSQNYEQHQAYSTAIAVGAGKKSDEIIFRLTPSGTITGIVSDESGEPLRNARVILFAHDVGNGIPEIYNRVDSTTDDEGHYRFSHVGPGTYYVGVEAHIWYTADGVVNLHRQRIHAGLVPRPDHDDALPDLVYPITFYPRATNSSGATPIIIRGGDAQTADIEVTAVPAVHLSYGSPGTDPSQFPRVQVMQTLFDNTDVPFTPETEMIRAGVFEITNLYPGHFKFRVQSNEVNDAAMRSGEMDVTSDGELNIPPKVLMATLSGQLSFENTGTAYEALQVEIQDSSTGELTPTQVGANGEFSFGLGATAPGTYAVFVMTAGATITPAVSAAGTKVTGNNIEIPPGKSVLLTLAASGSAHQVDGIALKDGKPAGGMRIMLVPAGAQRNTGAFRFDQSDSDGTFSLFTVGPGKYTVLALEDAWDLDWTKPGELDKFLAGGTAIQIGAGVQKAVEVKVQQK
jgi:Carboxypeptidase regulatory-like domain